MQPKALIPTFFHTLALRAVSGRSLESTWPASDWKTCRLPGMSSPHTWRWQYPGPTLQRTCFQRESHKLCGPSWSAASYPMHLARSGQQPWCASWSRWAWSTLASPRPKPTGPSKHPPIRCKSSMTASCMWLHGLVERHDMTRGGDMMWRDMTWTAVEVAWIDMTWSELTHDDMAWHDMTWHVLTLHDTIWVDMTWHDITFHQAKPCMSQSAFIGLSGLGLLRGYGSPGHQYCRMHD